jgi:hypothetical protein
VTPWGELALLSPFVVFILLLVGALCSMDVKVEPEDTILNIGCFGVVAICLVYEVVFLLCWGTVSLLNAFGLK